MKKIKKVVKKAVKKVDTDKNYRKNPNEKLFNKMYKLSVSHSH